MSEPGATDPGTAMTVPAPSRRRHRHAPARRRPARVLSLVAGIVAAALIAGCGGSHGASGAKAGQSGGSGGGGKGSLALASFAGPFTLNPATAQPGGGVEYLSLAYDPLIYQTADGRFVPDLAVRFGYLGSGNRTFAVQLRPGVEFSDGTALTAAAVKRYVEYFRDAHGQLAAEAANLTSVTTEGRLRVVLHFSRATPGVPYLLSQEGLMGDVVSPRALAHPAALGASTDGAGQYVLAKSGTVSGSTYAYVPNPHYWNPRAIHNSRVTVSVISSPSSSLAALQSGQADVLIVETPSIETSARAAGLQVVREPFSWVGLYLGDRSGRVAPPLGKVAVRQAINYALDRPALAKATQGAGGVATDQVCLPASDCYVPGYAPYSLNVARAKALLNSAGYGSGFSLTVGDFEGIDPNATLAEGIAGELAKIGIKLNVVTETTPLAYSADLAHQKFAAFILAGANAGAGMNDTWSQIAAPSGSRNPFHSDDATVNRLVAFGNALPAAESTGPYRRAARRLMELAWYAPVTDLPLLTIHTSAVKGIGTGSAAQPFSIANITGPGPSYGWYK